MDRVWFSGVPEACHEPHRGVFSRETITRYVDDCHNQLGVRAAVGPNFLPVIIDRFARKRLWAVAQADLKVDKPLPEVLLFVCERNAGRSQIAAGLAHDLTDGWVAVRCAGSHPDDMIDPTAHRARLVRLLPRLAREFTGQRTDAEIRACADAIFSHYDDVKVRSHVMTLAHHQNRDYLRAEHCYELDPANAN